MTRTLLGFRRSRGRQQLRRLPVARSRTKAAPSIGHRLKSDAKTRFKGAFRRHLVATVLMGLSAKQRTQPLYSLAAAKKFSKACSRHFLRTHGFRPPVLSLRVSSASCPTKGFVKVIFWMRGSWRTSLATCPPGKISFPRLFNSAAPCANLSETCPAL